MESRKKQNVDSDPDHIPNKYPLYPRIESSIVPWLQGGPDLNDPWPAECKFDYVRHYIFDQENPNCDKFSAVQKEACEAEQRTISGSDDLLYTRLVANNCPCHINCYRGCENCGTWDCPNREWVDPDTPIWAQPDGIGNENNIDGNFYELVFSDEFNGDLLNSNKWHLRDEQGKQRSHWLNEDGSETVKIQTL